MLSNVLTMIFPTYTLVSRKMRCGINGELIILNVLQNIGGKLPPNNTQTINFKVVELKFAFTLALFISDTLEEACEAMYAFGHIQEIIPPRFRAGRLDYHVDACYRVILQVYSKYTTDSIVDEKMREKMRVGRLPYALDYIQDKKNAEKNLCDYFFGSEK